MKDKVAVQRNAREALKRERKAKKAARETAPVLERSVPNRTERERMLIYCEGKNTEPSYFRQFRLATVEVKCFGEGYNTVSLVERAIKLRDEATEAGKPYDQVWCVFDCDDHGHENFNEAIRLADTQGKQVTSDSRIFAAAYSNQAFEYWLILHFEDHQGGAMPRNQYDAKINGHINPLGASYDGKESKTVSKEFFDLLEATDPKTKKRRRHLAATRAKKIYSQHDHSSPAKEESSTNVFRLIEALGLPD